MHADGLILFQFAFDIPEYGGKKNHCFTATTASEITTPYLKETDSLLWDYCACRGCFFDALWTFLRARNLDNLIKWWTVNVVHYRVNRG